MSAAFAKPLYERLVNLSNVPVAEALAGLTRFQFLEALRWSPMPAHLQEFAAKVLSLQGVSSFDDFPVRTRVQDYVGINLWFITQNG